MEFDPHRLAALRAAVETGTLEAAARSLAITPSAVSQRIKALELQTGRVLVRRTRPVEATESGEVLLRLARQADALAREAMVALGAGAGATGDRSAPRLEPLPLAVNADSLATWLLAALRPLAGEIAFELVRADESRTAELLRQGSVMAAITTEPTAVQGCSSLLLGAMRYRPMASGEFVRRRFGADVPSAAALAVAPVVVFDRADTLQHRYLESRGVDPALPPNHHVPSSADFVDAIRLGFGWGLVPELQLRQHDELVDLDPGGAIDVPLHWQQWQLDTRPLARTAAAVAAAASAALRAPAALRSPVSSSATPG
ncbi:ArgP/LysG family DNA-binding transcriptional regulator [Herbiconiux moechotypicola]|uniref:LysR family transcriptional regulator ArgP n=1 Tax=Herbiconiux moechotypicola TaxID=637393 RepID=A0ABN3E5Q3_9MICO|nr:ArgP/LysG family DNA-binding transcriptional regulator [Herbiconiux moechotypicola]MCS5731902.1 ArgP/LysG family DNA-binding transcriptional regulator [Herbiconiux moechotypicola]